MLFSNGHVWAHPHVRVQEGRLPATFMPWLAHTETAFQTELKKLLHALQVGTHYMFVFVFFSFFFSSPHAGHVREPIAFVYIITVFICCLRLSSQ